MKKINQFGMNLYQPYTVYPATSTNRLTFDLRSKEAYHGGHIEGTINIPYDKNFINQIGWYLNYNQEINLMNYRLIFKSRQHILYNLLDMIMCLDISYRKLKKFKHNLFIVNK